MSKNVKFFAKIGLRRKEEWVNGTIVSRDDNESVVEAYGKTYTLPNNKVKYWRRAEENEIETFRNDNWDRLKNEVTCAIKEFFPDKIQDIKFNEEEKTIELNDYIVIGAGLMERESIAGFIETPCWEVTAYIQTYGSYHCPPDVDEKCLGQSPNAIHVSKILVDALWEDKTAGYWENRQYQEMPEEYYA